MGPNSFKMGLAALQLVKIIFKASPDGFVTFYV